MIKINKDKYITVEEFDALDISSKSDYRYSKLYNAYKWLPRGQKSGVDYLMSTYGLTRNKALSFYRKAERQVAEQTNIHLTDTKAFQRYVTRTIMGTTSVMSNINILKEEVTVTRDFSSDDVFKQEVVDRLHNFMDQWKNTSIIDEYDKYISDQISYEELKQAIDNFKRTSPEYLVGSN